MQHGGGYGGRQCAFLSAGVRDPAGRPIAWLATASSARGLLGATAGLNELAAVASGLPEFMYRAVAILIKPFAAEPHSRSPAARQACIDGSVRPC